MHFNNAELIERCSTANVQRNVEKNIRTVIPKKEYPDEMRILYLINAVWIGVFIQTFLVISMLILDIYHLPPYLLIVFIMVCPTAYILKRVATQNLAQKYLSNNENYKREIRKEMTNYIRELGTHNIRFAHDFVAPKKDTPYREMYEHLFRALEHLRTDHLQPYFAEIPWNNVITDDTEELKKACERIAKLKENLKKAADQWNTMYETLYEKTKIYERYSVSTGFETDTLVAQTAATNIGSLLSYQISESDHH